MFTLHKRSLIAADLWLKGSAVLETLLQTIAITTRVIAPTTKRLPYPRPLYLLAEKFIVTIVGWMLAAGELCPEIGLWLELV